MKNKRGMVAITAPVALRGDKVLVLNYRKRPAAWEPGEVMDADYRVWFSNDVSKGSWSYRVELDRCSKRAGRIFCHVGNQGIKRKEW